MSDLPRDTGSRRYSDEHLDKLLLGDIVSEHAAPWELLAYLRHLEATMEEQSRRLVIETIISGHIREGRIQLLEIREGEAHVLAATAAIQRLSRPESWDPEEGSLLELRPMEPGTRT